MLLCLYKAWCCSFQPRRYDGHYLPEMVSQFLKDPSIGQTACRAPGAILKISYGGKLTGHLLSACAGPGAFDFQQGDTKGTIFWRVVSHFLKDPSAEQIACQAPKPILLDTGSVHIPYEWYACRHLPAPASNFYSILIFSCAQPLRECT